MDLQLSGKRALVTGGSRGIGRAIARQLAMEGCDVALAARDPARLSAAAGELAAETGRRVIGLPVDTGDDASVRAMVEAAVTALGGLDILVNSAAEPGGKLGAQRLADITTEALMGEVNIKVMGYLRVAQAVAPHLVAQGWGRIINVSGLAARQAHSIVGSVRNVAVAAMTKNLADELGPHGVNVTVVHPGATLTERTAAWETQLLASGLTPDEAKARMGAGIAIGRMVTAREIADVVAFLASPHSIAITGDAIPVGGGALGAIHY